jgi:hypothetical protein
MDSATLVERRVAFLDEKLNLTDAQKEEIVGIFQEHGLARADMRAENRREAGQQRSERLRGDTAAMHDAIAAVLTDEQKTVWAELRTTRPDRPAMRPGVAERRPFRSVSLDRGLVQRLVDRLELTEAQQTEIQQLLDQSRQDLREKLAATPNATREQFAAIVQEHALVTDAAVKSKLTTDQIRSYEALKAEQMQRARQMWQGRRAS